MGPLHERVGCLDEVAEAYIKDKSTPGERGVYMSARSNQVRGTQACTMEWGWLGLDENIGFLIA